MGLFLQHWIRTPIGWIEGLILSIGLPVLAILLFKVVSAQNPSTVIRGLHTEPLNSEETPEVLASVCRFSEMAGVPTPAVYWTSANHIATLSVGWSPAHSVIILNARALEVLTAEERDSVIALEIAHIKFRDHLLRSIVMSTAGLGFVFFAVMSLRIVGVYRDIWKDIRDGRNPHVLADRRLSYLLGTFIAPSFVLLALIPGIPIRTIVAEQEYRADAWSAHAVGSFLPLAIAISKLARTVEASNKRLRDYSVFCVAEPSPRDWVRNNVYSFLYPNYSARIKRLWRCQTKNDSD